MRTIQPIRASLLLLALGASLAADADQIVQTFTLNGSIEIDYFSGYTLDIDAFDSNLGTLTSVTIALDIQNSGTTTLLNRGDAADLVYFYGSSGGGLEIYRPGFDYVAAASGAVNDSKIGPVGHLETVTASLDYVGGVNGGFAVDNDGNFYEEPSGVFTGREVETFVARSAGERLTVYPFNAGGGIEIDLPHSTITTDFQGRMVATITYDYAPVPEPASLAALGLGALAVLRRRRA